MAGGSTRKERRSQRLSELAARRKRLGKPPAPLADEYTPKVFVRRAYTPPRAVKWAYPDGMPRISREWAALYLDGLSPEAISLGEGGYHKPWTIRRELKKWGVPMRRPGGRNSPGRSPLHRIAEVEREVARLAAELDRITSHLALSDAGPHIREADLS